MDEKKIKIEAYQKMKKELEHKFKEAFSDTFSTILMRSVEDVENSLIAKVNAE